MSELPKIGLGLTLLQQVDAFVAMRWIELLRSHYWPGPVLNGRGQYTVQARNIVVGDFMHRDQYPLPVDDWVPGELEALLFWDSDQLPPMVIPQPDGSLKVFTRHLQDVLVNNPEAEIIAGLYFSRETEFLKDANGNIAEFPHSPVAYERVADPQHGYAYRYLSHERMINEILPLEGRYRLHRVGGAGTGAMLIRKRLLERMATVSGPLIFDAPPTADGRQWTEDLWFCDRAQRLDPPAEIWLDPANESAHQGDRIWIRSQHYLAAHGQVGINRESAQRLEKTVEEGNVQARGKIILPDGWRR